MAHSKSEINVNVSLLSVEAEVEIRRLVPDVGILWEIEDEACWVTAGGSKLSIGDAQIHVSFLFSSTLSDSETFFSTVKIDQEKSLYFMDDWMQSGEVFVIGVGTENEQNLRDMLRCYISGYTVNAPNRLTSYTSAFSSRMQFENIWADEEDFTNCEFCFLNGKV